MAKAPYLGVVSFGRFVPDSGSVVLNEMHTPVLNEMHTNSYSGPRLINFNFDFLASEVFLKIASPTTQKRIRFISTLKDSQVRPLSDSKLSRSARVLKSDKGLQLVF